MSAMVAILALALAPQAPSPAVPVTCALESVEVKDGAYECTFKCRWPKGTALRLEITRRTTHVSWAPKVEKDVTGMDVELVSLAIQKRQRLVHRDTLKTDKDEGFVYAWTPKVAGVYHILVIYDPVGQSTVDPRFRKENRTAHRLLALEPGQARGIIVDDASEALRFSTEYFRTLRAGIQKSNTDVELEALMRPLIDEVLKRGETTQHPGTYSIMEHLSPYVMSEPKDPKKNGPNDPRVMSPNKIDIKTSNLPPSIVRESMILAILMMEDTLEEAALLAPLPDSVYTGRRRDAVELLAAEVPEAVTKLKKLAPASKLGYIFRVTQPEKILTDAADTVAAMLQKRQADEAATKNLLERLKEAAKTIGHPFDGMKE